MSIFKVFTHKLKKCNNNVKIYDNFTKQRVLLMVKSCEGRA